MTRRRCQTAEMPGFYSDGEYDVAGFAVGSVKQDQVIDGKSIQEGDILLGLQSSGVHSNGFSLVRKVLQVRNLVSDRAMEHHAILLLTLHGSAEVADRLDRSLERCG